MEERCLKGVDLVNKIITFNDLVFLLRILLAMTAGAVIGYEREYHDKVAGLRTHILLCMAASIMMIVSKYGFFDMLTEYFIEGIRVDVSRVAAGIIAGMGIFSGGIVFIGKRGNVSGITTAAGIWATIGIGMVLGAGMYAVGIGSVILVELVQLLLRHDLPVYRRSIVAIVSFDLKDTDRDYDELVKKLNTFGAKMSSQKWEKKSNGSSHLKSNVVFDIGQSRDDIVDILNGLPEAISFEIP